MPSRDTQPNGTQQKVLVIGAGVFGLSTALHLSKRGYAVHLFDYQPYHENGYAYSAGCDGASCDENKILRASYGNAKLYQDLALDRAMPEWQRWNELLSKTPAGELPPGVTPDVPLWNNCGYLRLSQDGLEQSEVETQANFPKEIRHTQYRISDAGRRRDAEAEGVASAKIDPFGRLEKGLPTDGVLDMTGGFVLASRACAFALHLCLQAGVETHLGAAHGLKRLIRHGQTITGIATNDGREHHGDLVIMACGGWTPSLLPEIERLIETTAGSVLSIRLPQERKDLWDRYSPESFPVWTWNMYGYERRGQDIGGLYGLPRTPEGVVKIAFRGAKWTNYSERSQSSGDRLSYPKTDVDEIPEEAMRVIKTFCEENLPDLLELELERGRLCWYSDSIDNSFIIDYVPNTDNLLVANGGSGHGFKFLPVLGDLVVDVVERKETPYTRLFKWREVPDGARNGLEEGPGGWRTLDKQQMAGRRQWRREGIH